MANIEPLTEEIKPADVDDAYSFDPLALIDVTCDNKTEQQSSTLRPKVSLKFEDLCVNVNEKNFWKKLPDEKKILQNIAGTVRSGQLLVIMGPSGSGKTTLLNALAGRLSASGNFNATGTITVNGKKRNPATFKKISAYVMQDENMFGNLTVEEQISISGKLRLPRTFSEQEKRRRIEDVISEMGLMETRKTFIGSENRRGVSGGERKRVSIGKELVTDPSLLFLDEPTSGLDSFNAENVVKTLVRLSKDHRAIVMTVHQPGSNIFNLFDMLLLLSKGKIMYFGPAKKAVSYFSLLGYECPSHSNPADYFLDLIAVDIRSSKLEQDSLSRIAFLHKAYNENVSLQNRIREKEATWESTEDSNGMNENETWEKHPYPYWMEFSILLIRAWKLLIRERVVAGIRTVQTLIFSILVGLIWLNKGRNISSSNYEGIEGVLFYILIIQSFMAIFGIIFAFPLERSIVLRERASGMYRVSAYYLSKILVELPRTILFCLLFCVVVGIYLSRAKFVLTFEVILDDWPSRFRRLFFSLCCCHAFEFIDRRRNCFDCFSAPTPKVAAVTVPLILNIAVLFGGALLSNAEIPNHFVWLKFSSFMKYSYGALMQNQFVDFAFQSLSKTCVICDGNEVLEDSGITDFSMAGNIGMLLMELLVFRIAAYLVLRMRGPKHDKAL
ncbi:ABC transporter, ATP-binding protein [Galdieria sulphuraria]|uniref:Probable ATP-dependent transporter ycf16 n=1 Tax=Galdieria sulphuraria TaxID=130081 RepID=M2VZV8_GALSU|nr:ABC transporter, ATP-binding protein [Galdieria sulphuraria]EME28881.1 ABC transporter, ATP-binding protein [Galdieria sulphuraria]|eukprot:XP_005705401.1 ABC transporter, ATP-binding protein [Galdieria sulphuraria]